MPDTLARLFEVMCRHCGHSLARVERIGDPEIEVLEAHLRVCCPSDPFPPGRVMLGEVMARVRVASVEPA